MIQATPAEANSAWIVSIALVEVLSLLLYLGTVLADFQSLADVMLIGCYKFDVAVALLVVVPFHIICNPQAALLFAGQWFARIIRPVFNCAEQRL